MSEAPVISQEDLASVDPATAAAFVRRCQWLEDASDPRRGGKQIPPTDGAWDQLIFRSGRGFGKTRALTEWQWWECWRVPGIIGHAVGPIISDMEGTLFTGPAGFRAVVPAECLRGESWEQAYDVSKHRLFLKNGSIIRGFGATDGGARLRGPQCHNAIGDELREWDRPAGALEAAHSNLMFGVRLPYPDGTPARAVFGTTPKPIAYLLKLYRQPGVRVVTGTSYENLHNLSDAYRRTLLSKEGTKIGRVEIHGEDIGVEDGAIFQRSWFRLWPHLDREGKIRKLPEFTFILQTMDTAFEEENYDARKGKDPDFSACGILGVFNTQQCFSDQERKVLKLQTKYAAVLCDFWMERLGYPDLLEKARLTYRTKYGAPGRYPDVVLIEKKASGISLRQSLMRYGVPTWPFDPKRQGKTERANAASPYVLQGHLFVPESSLPYRAGEPRDWAEPLLEQMCAFQGEGSVEYDDGLDAITQGVLDLARRGFFSIEPQGTKHPDPDEKEEAEQRRAMAAYEKEKRGVESAYGS